MIAPHLRGTSIRQDVSIQFRSEAGNRILRPGSAGRSGGNAACTARRPGKTLDVHAVNLGQRGIVVDGQRPDHPGGAPPPANAWPRSGSRTVKTAPSSDRAAAWPPRRTAAWRTSASPSPRSP